MTLAPNTLISHYRILSSIGKGGMGEVYLAQDTKLNRKVAIKFLSEKFLSDSDKLNRFIQEAQAASALNHPNIVTIHEIGEADDSRYIALEYIEGDTLTRFLRKTLTFDSALDIAIQLASALDAAHSAGIVHRDIKPDNVMIRPDGVVKILDFGIAKLTEKPEPSFEPEGETAVQVNTSPGMIIGTANYMSPEQAKGKGIDSRTDIFSLGVLLYEMISGHLPFPGDSPLEIIGSILNKEPKPIRNEDVPPELERIVSKSLRKDRDERYQTMKGLLADLKEVKRQMEFQDHLERTVQPERAESETKVFQATTAEEANQTTAAQTRNDSISIDRSSFGKVVAVLGTILVLTAVGIGYWYYFGSSTDQINSIAVMPFVNEGNNADVEYLSDGMTESLISSLTEIPNLSVKARSTVFFYKGKEKSVKEIGEELGVEAVLLGRVAQRGEDLKLTLELVDTQTLNSIWSNIYNRKRADLITLQSDIARDVATKLKSKLSGVEETKVTKTGTADPEAYQAYLKGRFFWNRRTSENLKRAIEQFKIATDRDPNYALAYTGLADCYVLMNFYAGTPNAETVPKAMVYAKRAIAIDDLSGESHASLAQVLRQSWQWEESEREFKRAIELNPNYATAYHWYSRLFRELGRLEESEAMIYKAKELDPLSSVIGVNISEILLIKNDYDASVEYSLKIIELDPDFPAAHRTLGLAYLKLGRKAEAIAALEKAAELRGRSSLSLGSLGYAYAETGRRPEALAIIKELEEKFSRNEGTGRDVAAVYSGLGDKDKAFEWLEKTFERKGDLGFTRWEIPWESLREDPRYKDLLKRMGLKG